MRSGSGLRRSCRVKLVTPAAPGVTTGFLSKRFFGLRVWARHGAICRKRSASGLRRIAQKDVWERDFKALRDDPDSNMSSIDGALVRVHQHGTSAKGGLKIR